MVLGAILVALRKYEVLKSLSMSNFHSLLHEIDMARPLFEIQSFHIIYAILDSSAITCERLL